MKSNLFAVCTAILGILMVASCSKVTTLSTFYNTKPEFLSDEGDGALILRAYGKGRNKQDALAQAQINAVNEIVFNGVTVPGNPVLSRPLLCEVNAHEKYADFFNDFFRENGAYRKFVDYANIHKGKADINWNATQAKVSTIIRVERAELKTFLQKLGIIKSTK